MTDTLVEHSDDRLLQSGAKMLTRQSVIAESTCVGTVPINFVATEDGRTLLVVTEHEDGVVEIVATPMTLVTQNNAAAASLVKNLDGNVLLQPPVFQISLEDIDGTALQQSALLPVQPVESAPVVFQRDDFQVNEEIQRERSLPSSTVRVADNVSPEKSDRKESTSMEKTADKRNPGRPKKREVSYLQSVENLRCDICQREFTKQSSYRKHLESHVEEKPHRCPKCPASFNIPTNFTLHMATHNSGDPKCPECGKKFARMASLKAHMLLHEKEENLFCTECEDAFTTKAQLDAHLKLHGEKWTSEEARKCKLCNKQFVQPALYRLHIREHYRLQTKVVKQTKRGAKHKTMYKCTICLKSFQKPSQLMRHIRVHTGEKPFKCTICGRAFTQKSSLQIHTWQHNGIRPHTCDLCNARFSQKGNLNAHILRVHNAPEGEPIYGCTYCSCIFKKLGSLNGHIKRMHTNLNEEKSADRCSDADMRATVDSVMSQLATLESTANDTPNLTDSRSSIVTKNDILQQALRNSGLPNTLETKRLEARTNFVTLMDRSPDGGTRKYLTIRQRCVGNVRWYACSFCHKEFKKPSDLIRHLRVHTQEKPFKCSHCFRSFALKSTMIAHERTHTGGKRYSCGSCNKTFACHGSLAAHARLHAKHPKYTTNEPPRILDAEVVVKHQQARNQSKGRSKLSPEAESLVPQVVLQEPLVICDAGNKICVAQVPPKQKRTYEEGVLDVARPHKCWVCHAAFRKISHLKQHYRRHTGERPYKCAKCDRRFTSNSVLKSHLHTHDDSRPYSCSVCSTKFSTQSSMKRHLVTHSNKRPFMCPYCHKTFKTYVNCRKHMKIHKHELAQRQLEQQRTQGQNGTATTLREGEGVKKTPEVVTSAAAAAAADNLAISDDIGISFQSQIGTEDFTEAFSEQLKNMADEKEKSLSSSNNGVTSAIVNQSLPGVSMTDLGSTQMLHADETGTVTLPTYAGDQTLTPESIREIEETLNQQLFGIGMNLDNGREQPVLSVIYENNKSIEPHGGNVFGSQFDSFDMTQIALQSDNEIGITLDTANSTSMASILPRSAKEEQRLIPVTACANLAQNSQEERPDSQAMLLISKQSSLETLRLTQTYQKYPKTVGKENLVNADPAEKQRNGSIQKHCGIDASSLQNGTGEISFVEEEFRDSAQSKAEAKVRAALSTTEIMDSNDAHDSIETSTRCETRLQCHMCSEQGFTAPSLKEHLKTHRGEKEYQCTECSLRFCTNGGLSRHSKIHANKQRWKCTACQKILNSKAQVRSHGRLHDVAWNVTSSETGEPRKPLLSSDAKADSVEGCSMNAAIIESDSSISEKVLLDTVAEKEVMDRAESVSETIKERKEYTNKCKYCPKTFRKPSDLVRHVRTHTGERPYKCDYCSKSFAVKCTLDSHMKVHTGKKTFRCHVCSSLFATKGSLKVHMRLHTGSKPFRCSICDLRFRTSGHRKVHLLKHAKEHKGVTKRRQKHLKVAAIAEVAANLEKSNERSQKPLVTSEHRQENVPGTDFTSLGGIGFEADTAGLTDQITFNSDGTVSNNNSVLSVNDCNQLVANLQFLLANGLVTIQTEETLIPQPSNLEHRPTQIVDSSVNIPPIESSGNDDDLNNETRRVVQAVIQSNNCVFGTTRLEPTLKVERVAEKQTNRGTPSKKECDVCGKIFMKPYQVERHKRIHTGERPYKCDLCTKSFAQKSTLQMHQKHHTGDRPYPCPHCEYSFTQKGNLQTHVKRVHQLDTLEIKKLRRARQPFVAKSLQENLTEVKILSLDDISFVEFLK